ncbi:hypothetical protein LTR84_004870 [Exophiala bonariae]|uniref:Stc1 domain-containing protein n=1 Tax=Exophiala bonariae TaxID=1690606 RepID=A0AAV9NRV4_9EURO|nr:hypothetical protein LTR84_004870 [Exophiala bonariae]
MDRLTDVSRYANVDTGNMIRCSDCGTKKMISRFSNTQINKYKAALVNSRRNTKDPPLPRCIACTAGSVVELHCTWCGISKPVAEFSARHRSNPDEAKCTSCQQENDDREPDLEAAAQEEVILDEYNMHKGAISNMSSVASALPSLSGRASEMGSTAPSGMYQHSDKGFGGATGFRPPSPTPSNATSQFLAASTAGYSAGAPGSVVSQGGASSRFVKQGAWRPPVIDKVVKRSARDEKQQKLTQVPTSATHHDGDKDSDDDEWEL